MKDLKIYSKQDLNKITRKRAGETKIGEQVQFLGQEYSNQVTEGLKKSKSRFVLIGLPEDIGIRANFGRGGAHSAWIPAVNNLLNMQSNQFCDGKELLVLGHIEFEDLMKKADALNTSNEKDLLEIRKIVDEVDQRVSPVIEAIILAGKEAIIVGGGHNNAYPNIKGTVEALRKIKKDKTIQLGVINCDAHSDYRKIEGRHSGNGFRYAFNKGYLSRYSMIGLHENYNSVAILDELQKNTDFFSVSYFEDIFIRQNIKFEKAIEKGLKHLKNNICGIEIDMDAVQNIPTSAKTSSGISTIQARQYVHWTASKSNSVYLHIAEAAPVLSHIKADNKTGKLIAYLISDYIKAKSLQINKK